VATVPPLFELNWAHRFLFRDLSDLLSKNRHLETHFQQIQIDSMNALTDLLHRLRTCGILQMEDRLVAIAVSNLMVVLNNWFNHEYVLAPRHAANPEQGKLNSARGALQMLSLLAPWLCMDDRLLMQELSVAQLSSELQTTTA